MIADCDRRRLAYLARYRKAMAKKPKRRHEKSRLADPVTYAAMDMVMTEAKARFEPRARLLATEIKALVDKRKEDWLTTAEEVQMTALRAQFDALSIEYKRFIEPMLVAHLEPPDGNEMADA